MRKIDKFLKESIKRVQIKNATTFESFSLAIQHLDQRQENGMSSQIINHNNLEKVSNQNNEQEEVRKFKLQNLSMLQSKVVQSKNKQKRKSVIQKQLSPQSRIKDIQNQKRRILSELEKLDCEIAQIKQQKQDTNASSFAKKQKISDNLQAKKQAQQLIKELHKQKKKIQDKKRKQQQKSLLAYQKQQEQRRKLREEQQKRAKEEKRLFIEKRMQLQKKRRAQREIIEKQSNQLIVQLKKQQKYQKIKDEAPSQINEIQQKKRILQKKSTFNMGQIQQHQKKYKQLKSRQKQLKRERSQSIKVNHHIPKFAKNIWIQQLQSQQNKKKEEQRVKQMYRKNQLQKRMQYGDLVKNMFVSKSKRNQVFADKTPQKPRTPDVNLNEHFPPIKSQKQRKTQTDNKSFQQKQVKKKKQSEKSENIIQQEKFQNIQINEESIKIQNQKQKMKKIREAQLRRQTKERLKKLQNRSIDAIKPQKIKYENYIGKVKVKKKDYQEDWKKIMDNQFLSKQDKYREMLNKASSMENKAKLKEDLRKQGDQEAVKLYIGSIQAKLALLQQF